MRNKSAELFHQLIKFSHVAIDAFIAVCGSNPLATVAMYTNLGCAW